MLLVCIIGIFFVASASAIDLNETTVLDIDDSGIDDMISGSDSENAQEELSIEARTENSKGANYTPKDSSEIQSCINCSNDGDMIILDGYYLINETILVDKQINFIGVNNATIDGLSKVKLVHVTAYDVKFKNILFKNGNASNGGAVSCWGPNHPLFENCVFINNSASDYGGAITYANAVNCIFINNSVSIGDTGNGGAMYYGSAKNCSFIGNSAEYGGAIYGGTISNCTFINNTAEERGGAIYQNYGSVVNCSFVGNSAKRIGGAIWKGSAMNCSFVNNSANSGGAIYDTNAVNCSFVNNFAENGGGAINEGSAVNCSFIHNSAQWYGGAMAKASAINCSFINNDANNGDYGGGAIYDGSAVNCSFIGNSAKIGGAMSYGSAVNCSFVNNSATEDGGALASSSFENCTFINNSAKSEGGAVSFHLIGYSPYQSLKIEKISNCIFINNSASLNGGAIDASHGYRIFNITNCIFIDNRAITRNGGAINVARQLFNVINCSFKNNSAFGKGGAVYTVQEGNISHSNIIDCSAGLGGAIWTENNLNINNCNFTNCTSDSDVNYLGCIDSSLYNVSDCIFDVAPKNIEYYYRPTLTVNDLFIAKGDKGVLYANLSNVCGPLVNKKVDFIFDGMKFYSVTNSEGIAEFNVNKYLTSLGETIVNLNFTGDDINCPVYANSSVYINRYHGNLTVSVDGEFYNDTFLIFKLVNSVTNVPISDAQLRLNFSNGKIFNITTDFDGYAVFNIPFVPYAYDVFAYVNEDYVNVNNVSVDNIVIKKLVGDIEVIPLNDNHTLMIRLFDPEDSSAVYRNVKINLDVGPKPIVKEELFTNENGYVMYDLLNFTKGTYSISVTVRGDYKDFYDYRLTDYVISNLLNSKLNFSNNITFEFGEFGSCNFTVEGCIVEYNNIKVLNHTEAIIGLSANTISVSQLSVGNYVLQVETTPDDYHNPINKTLSIVVTNAKSKVTFSAGVVFEYGSSSSIHVIVEGGEVESKNIKVVGHPEANIQFSGNVITVSGLAVGSYDLQVTSTPDSDHLASTGTVKVTVKKATAVIKASKVTVAYKKGSQWIVKFVDSKSGRPIANMNVALKVFTGKKFKTVDLKTNSKGEASFQTKKLSKGTHKVVVTATDSRYNFNSYSSSIKVVKQTAVKFKVKKKTAVDGASLSITVLNKKTKKPINGVKIKLQIKDGKKTKVVVLKSMKKGKYKGVCGYGTNKLSVGTHKVTILPVDVRYGGLAKSKMKITKKAKKVPAWETKDTAK